MAMSAFCWKLNCANPRCFSEHLQYLALQEHNPFQMLFYPLSQSTTSDSQNRAWVNASSPIFLWHAALIDFQYSVWLPLQNDRLPNRWNTTSSKIPASNKISTPHLENHCASDEKNRFWTRSRTMSAPTWDRHRIKHALYSPEIGS